MVALARSGRGMAALPPAGSGMGRGGSSEKVVNVYNWSDYIDPRC